MILKPTSEDYKIIGYYLGKILIGIGMLMFIPLAIAIFYSESAPAMDFLMSISIALLAGAILVIICYT